MKRRDFIRKGLIGAGGLAVAGLGLERAAPRLWRERVSVEPNTAFWAKATPRRAPQLTRDLEADIVVVGGGITGLSSALALRRNAPEKRVVVLEARGIGNGASGRSGGFLLSWPSNEYMRVASTPQLHRRLYDLTATAMHEEVALAHAAGFETEAELKGVLMTLRPGDVDAARAYVDEAKAAGVPIEFWSAEKTRATLGVTNCAGALFDPNGSHVDPMQLTLGLGAAAASSGALIFEDSPVAEVEEGETLRLHLAGGQTVKAPAVVLATNTWTTQLGFFRNAIFPAHNYMGITPPLTAGELARAGLQSHLPFTDSRTNLIYMGLTRENRFRIGGGYSDYSFNNGTETNGNAALVTPGLRRELGALYPSLSEVPFEAVWGGVVDCTLDNAPSVGVTGDHRNIYYGLGYCGHGMVMAFLAGRIIGDLATGRAAAWTDVPFVNRKMPYIPNEPFRWLGAKGFIAALDLVE